MPKVKSIFATTGVCVLIAFICLFGFNMFQNCCAAIFEKMGFVVPKTDVEKMVAAGFWRVFLVNAVLPPLLEELIFRLLLCQVLKLFKLPNIWIIGLSAVVFALYHQSWAQLVYQLIMGIFFAWIYLKSKQIGWTMLIHFINNAFIITYIFVSGTNGGTFTLDGWNVTLAIGLAVVSTIAVTFLIKKGIPDEKK